MLAGLVISVIQFAVWLSDAPNRERAFFAAVVAAAVAGCAATDNPNDRFSTPFFSGPLDPHHVQWLERVRADKL